MSLTQCLLALTLCWQTVSASPQLRQRYDAAAPTITAAPSLPSLWKRQDDPSKKPSTWSKGACTLNPSRAYSSLSCSETFGLGQDSTFSGTTTTVCDCPDGAGYMQLSGGKTDVPNHQCQDLWTAQNDLKVAIPTACPTPEPSKSSTETSSAPTYSTTVKLKVDHPGRCWSTTLDFSSSYPIQTGYVTIEADQKDGWGVVDSQWKLSSNNGVELNNVRAPCEGGICESWNGNQAQQPGNVKQSPDKKSWTFSVTSGMQPNIKIVGEATGGSGDGKFDLTLTSTPPCGKPLYTSGENWNFTVANWKDANVDEEFKSWALNLNPNAPTGTLTRGTYPTDKAMPKRDSEFATINGVKGLVGSFISIASGGKAISCQLVPAGELDNCPAPPSITEAAPNMPRWVFFAWKALYNLHLVHYAITGVILSQEAPQLGQTTLILADFVKEDKSDADLAIFLSVLGAVTTVVGIGVAIKGIGSAATVAIKAGDAAKAARLGGIPVPKGGGGKPGEPQQVVRTGPNQPQPVKPQGQPENPDAITPIPPRDKPVADPDHPVDPDATVNTYQKPQGNKFTDPGFLGNAALVCPGVMTGMANSIWQQIDKAQTMEAKVQLDQAAVGMYMSNTSMIIQGTNDALLTFKTGDEDATNKLLGTLKDGVFINVEWDTYLYQTAIAADVVSRQINQIWADVNQNVYVTYTFLDDDEYASKCAALKLGTPSTQFCGDKGVYYMSSMNPVSPPYIHAPQGFDKMPNYGINTWWPTAGSSKAYSILNPDREANPPKLTADDDKAFSDYIVNWATANVLDVLNLVGTTPGTWSLPVCDQGYNTWTFDWSKTDGYFRPKFGMIYDSAYYWPCSCGHHGSGTKAFYAKMSIRYQDLQKIAGICAQALLNVDPGQQVVADVSNKGDALKVENMGWNLIGGGKPPKGTKIEYGDCDGCQITIPDDLPTKACWMWQDPNDGCPNVPKAKDCVGLACQGRKKRDLDEVLGGNSTEN